MSFEPKQEDTGTSPVIEAKSLLSKGDVEGAFAVLKEGAENGNVMACFDCGFMMIQGIGCKNNRDGGFQLISKGVKLEEESKDVSWKSNGSVTELFKPQSVDLGRLFFIDEYGFESPHFILNSRINKCDSKALLHILHPVLMVS